ncbi:hypothetical protein FGE12_21590 [Aggregicoccus sp. 17bor-14]|uniref:hypothetical protein n=1 Tax=Myxococcaceae TaxID=31 RepID=UPI00129CC14C|nr:MULTISPECIES: hypothetical protein [Myxococcaceae]MBF5045010.1 hypothetical protein [Simulacricoccus sp. 17bor-14]MRI90753.1 hypothetical protein [Aggregicoccus sp. 17bor-14]
MLRPRPSLLLLLLPLLGCAAPRPRPEGGYQVGLPGAPWRPLGVKDNDRAYAIEGTGQLLQANATCEEHGDPPLDVLTRHLLMGFTDQQLRAQARVPVDGREALRSRYGAKLDGVPVELDLLVLKKDGCVYDFSYVSPPALFESRLRDFEQLVAGFHAGGRAS